VGIASNSESEGCGEPKNMWTYLYPAAGASLLKRAKDTLFVQGAAFVCKIRLFPQYPPSPGRGRNLHTHFFMGSWVFCKLEHQQRSATFF
jgi:hypothetical protein